MTDEEMAEEYIKSNNLEWELECHRTSPVGEVKQAFLAGLKAGKDMNVATKWHKVADGDIPPDRHNVMSEKGEIVIMKDMRWYEYSPNYDNILQRSWEEPKYWCEKLTV